MKHLLLTTALLALASPALAGNDIITNNSGVANTGTVQNSTINNGTTGAGAFSPTSTSTATGGTAIAGGGSATAVAAPVAVSEGGKGGNAAATTGPITFPKNPKQAPAVFAPGLANGYDCNGSASFGGSIAGFGIGGGSTVVSEVCENVFLSRELERKGDKDASWGVLCEIDKVRKHSSKCPVADYRDDVVRDSEYPSMSSDSPKH